MNLPLRINNAVHFLIEQVADNGSIVLFGSHTSGSAHINADYDIGIIMERPIPWRIFSLWRFHCEELAWPYNIDVVDLRRAPTDFLQCVKENMIILHGEWKES